MHDLHRAFRHANQIVFCSHGTRNMYHRLDLWDNSTVVHSGIDLSKVDAYSKSMTCEAARRRIGSPRGKKVIVSVGTVCERKSQHLLVKAAARLKQYRDDFCCYIVGFREHVDPFFIARIRGLIIANNLQDVVHLIPETPSIYDYYRAADVFVLSSRIESYSLAVLEAEAFGLPIVTTPCCGVAEQVRENINAYVFPMSDAKSLASHLERLLDDERKRKWMGNNSRAQLERLPKRAEMLARYEQIIVASASSGVVSAVA